jgi:ATP-dependent DNA helicase RecG
MVGGLLLDSMDVLKVGVGLGTVLCAVLGSSAIELVARKFGWTKKLETAVITDEQLEMPDLNARQINGLTYAKRAKRLTNSEYQKLNNVSRESAKYDLSELVENGRLKLLGSKKGSYYAPISSPNVPK